MLMMDPHFSHGHSSHYSHMLKCCKHHGVSPALYDCLNWRQRPNLVPELPDIVVYIEALEKRILGQTLEHVRIASPFLLRTADPPVAGLEDKRVVQLRRMGKRICIGLENDLWLVLHLMIAGRLHWKKRGVKVSPPRGLAAFDFTNGTLLWTEAGSRKRASLHVVWGEIGLRLLDPGGLEVLETDLARFAEVL